MGAGCCSTKSKVVHKSPELEWQDMLRSYKLENLVSGSSMKFKELVYQGIPTHLRWEVWMKLLKVSVSKQEYDDLLQNSTHDEQIDKDIHRTFPGNEFISSESGQKSLKNVLSVLSHTLTEGYWQGMNYIVGLVLIQSIGNEAESYFFLKSLFTEFRANLLFERNFKTLNEMCEKFHKSLETQDHLLEHTIKTLHLDDHLWVFKWFITMFTYNFNFKTIVRVWDALLVNDLNFLVSISVSVALELSKSFQDKSIETVLALCEKPDIDIDKVLYRANKIKILE